LRVLRWIEGRNEIIDAHRCGRIEGVSVRASLDDLALKIGLPEPRTGSSRASIVTTSGASTRTMVIRGTSHAFLLNTGAHWPIG